MSTTVVSKNQEVVELKQRLRMIISHATGGWTTGEDMSINDICVEISKNRNIIYAQGIEDGRSKLIAAGDELADKAFLALFESRDEPLNETIRSALVEWSAVKARKII